MKSKMEALDNGKRSFNVTINEYRGLWMTEIFFGRKKKHFRIFGENSLLSFLEKVSIPCV